MEYKSSKIPTTESNSTQTNATQTYITEVEDEDKHLIEERS